MGNQLKLLSEDIDLSDESLSFQRSENKKWQCRYHRWVSTKDDFIEVTYKKSGRKVIQCRLCRRQIEENRKQQKLDWLAEKKQLSDYYIRRLFAVGRNSL